MSELLRADAVSKTFDATGPAPVTAVRGASLAIARGETVVITGPSGSGKTTLLSMLGGLLAPDTGRVWLAGIDVGGLAEPARRALRATRVGFVFQRGLLLEHLSVRQNVTLLPRSLGTPAAEAAARADHLLDRLGVAQRARHFPRALSAGECQRVAVARALANDPPAILADEPTGSLDSKASEQVFQLLRDLVDKSGKTVVAVTHDLELAARMDRRIHLVDGAIVSDQKADRTPSANPATR